MPKHWIEENVHSLEDFSVNCACPQFNVRSHRNLNTRHLNYCVKRISSKSIRKESNNVMSAINKVSPWVSLS